MRPPDRIRRGSTPCHPIPSTLAPHPGQRPRGEREAPQLAKLRLVRRIRGVVRHARSARQRREARALAGRQRPRGARAQPERGQDGDDPGHEAPEHVAQTARRTRVRGGVGSLAGKEGLGEVPGPRGGHHTPGASAPGDARSAAGARGRARGECVKLEDRAPRTRAGFQTAPRPVLNVGTPRKYKFQARRGTDHA